MSEPVSKKNIHRRHKINWQKVAPYLFVSPFIIAFCLFSVYPFFSAIKMSFEQVNGVAGSTWIGLTNYKCYKHWKWN